MGHFGPKTLYSASSKLQMHSKDFVKFCTMKGAKRHVKFILVIFAKKYLVEGEWVIQSPKMLCPLNSGSAVKDLFIILHNERGEEAHEN